MKCLESAFQLILEEVKPFIIFGPEHAIGDSWDLHLITLNYQGQEIDLGGAYETKIFDPKKNKWIPLISNFNTSVIRDILDIKVPVIAKSDLIAYKKVLNREVDQIDISQIN